MKESKTETDSGLAFLSQLKNEKVQNEMNQFIERVKNVEEVRSRFRAPKEQIELQHYFLPHYFSTSDIYAEEELMKKSA